MSERKQFRLPDVGEGLTEAEIVSWKVKPGDTVAVNTVLVEIETAKSLVELPSPFAGVVGELLVAEGQTVDVGTPIIGIDTGPGQADAAPEAGSASDADADAAPEAGLTGGAGAGGRTAVLVGYGPRTTESARRPRKARSDKTHAPQLHEAFSTARQVGRPVAPPHPPRPVTPVPGSPSSGVGLPPVGTPPAAGGPATGAASSARVLAKPPVRKLAKDLGVDLATVSPTGPQGSVTREDVLAVGENGGAAEVSAPDAGARETRVPIKGVRKMTAQAMVRSAFTAPHVTEFVTVDVTRTMKLVDRLREDREFEGVRVSPLLVVAKAMLLAVRRHPQVNASWDDDAQEIVLKHYVNLGIAASTPRGLVVPNIKEAQSMSLRELAEALSELTSTAREGRTQPAQMSGGTISITNVGVFGVDTGTPILNPGEAAILCFGAVRRMPWVHKGRIRPRQVTQLALSFDHRLVDGDLGSRFLADVAAVLERPDQALVWS